jgi:hypothetical protein
MTEFGKGREFQCAGQYGHHSGRLHLSPQSREEKEDTHRAFSYTTVEVSVDPEHRLEATCPAEG